MALWYMVENEVSHHTFLTSEFSRELSMKSLCPVSLLSVKKFVIIILNETGWVLGRNWE